jgi:hypothetical protein
MPGEMLRNHDPTAGNPRATVIAGSSVPTARTGRRTVRSGRFQMSAEATTTVFVRV